MDITWDSCLGPERLQLFKNPELYNDREYFSGIDSTTYESKFLYYEVGDWGISTNLGDPYLISLITSSTPLIIRKDAGYNLQCSTLACVRDDTEIEIPTA